MRKTALSVALPVAALVISLGSGWSSAAENASRGFRLQLFDSCGALVDYTREQAAGVVTHYGLPNPPVFPRATQFQRPSQRTDYSTTNVQEEGIDEPDVVKTNGRHLFAVEGSKLHAVAVRGRPSVVDTLEVGGVRNELLLRRNRLLVLSPSYSPHRPRTGAPRYVPPYERLRTVLTEVDVSAPW